AAVDATSGALLPWRAPLLYLGPYGVWTIVATPSLVYAGGDFQVDLHGLNEGYLGAFDARTGKIPPGWVAQTQSDVGALALRGGRLYVGGAFSEVNDSSQGAGLAALAPP